MARCWPSLVLFLAYTHATTLSSDLTNLIPECAQDCLVSFIDASFSTSQCGDIPSLECLCTSNSNTGFTIGEGAVDCIVTEKAIGFCNSTDSSDQVVLEAYTMCDAVPDAQPETHSVIVATLIVQSSAPSSTLASPRTTIAATTSSSSIATSSSSQLTSNSLSMSSNSISITGNPGSSTSTSQATASSLSPATSTSASPLSTKTLSKPQVIGITVASIGVGTVALGTVAIFACLRRRRARKDRESDLFPFTSDPSDYQKYPYYAGSTPSRKSKFGFSPFRPAGRKELGPGATSNGVARRMPPPVPPRIDTGSPNMFSRRSIKPEEKIGIAISPENTMPYQRTPATPETMIRRPSKRTSKLLPEKPSLRLQMPPKAVTTLLVNPFEASSSHPVPSLSNGLRQSTATQFEEDEEPSTTRGLRDTWGTADADEQDLRVLRATNPDPTPSPTPPRPTYGGERRPAQAPRNGPLPDYYIQPLFLNKKGVPSAQPEWRSNNFSRAAKQQSASPLDEFPNPPSSNGQRQPPRLQIPSQGPITATSSVYTSRTTSLPAPVSPSPTSRQPKKYKQVGPYDTHKSIGSMTSFEDNSPTSPVESPTSGRSPVSYPRIPKAGSGRLPEETIRMVPPPPQPIFNPVMMDDRPWRTAEFEAARRRRDDEIKAQEQAMYQTQVQRQEKRNSLIQLQLPERTSSKSYHNAEIPPSNRGRFQPPPPLRGALQRPGMGAQRPAVKKSNEMPIKSMVFPRSGSPLSHISEDSAGSSIAQRRGVATLALTNDASKGNKWRVLKAGEKEAAKSPGWRPMANTGRDLERQEPAELPGTPGWLPKLTPTRRGDELFINVQ